MDIYKSTILRVVPCNMFFNISRLDFVSLQKEAKSNENQAVALKYNKRYYFWELVCHSAMDLVPTRRPKS
jgi:hypothetical protein